MTTDKAPFATPGAGPTVLRLSVRALCEFLLRGGSIDSRFSGLDRGGQGARIHRRLQKQGGPGYKAEVALRLEVEREGFLYQLSGRADGVLEGESGLLVEEIKTVSAPLALLEEDSHPEHWAQGLLYAHILCEKRGLESCGVRLRYFNVDTEEQRIFERQDTAAELANFVEGLLAAYHRWALLQTRWKGQRTEDLQALAFPYADYRAGQRSMAVASYNTCKKAGRLLCCAPTGIGKTMSALFPAMKAMGEGFGERIFYLTAKTITRQAAGDALALLRGGGTLAFRSLVLTAKDKICFLEQRACLPESCPYADGYYDRLNDALYRFLQAETTFERETIEAFARAERLCPYELSLDLALWCDCIICDYNYLFDPKVHLQRFFETEGDYLFLIDEAHNLLDRSREMYSASLRKSAFYDFKKELPKSHKALHRALAALNTAFVALRKDCDEEQSRVRRLEGPPTDLTTGVERFIAAAEAFLEESRGSEAEQQLLALYFDALFYLRILEEVDERYATLCYRGRGEVTVKLLCLDPASFLDEGMAKGRASVLFSATLQPLAYYKETLGCGGAAALCLPSPFEAARAGFFVAESISTKYARRDETLPAVVEMIVEMASARRGNYIAYFPSYSYMNKAVEAFSERFPDIAILPQQSGLDEAGREAFLAAFSAGNRETLVGFCVLGGLFAEGVDLPGERLVGCAVVGVGLPQIGPEVDALRDYYDDKNGFGFEYAYQFPGMNKVLQAAGRVIRTPEDRGVVLLIDDRFPSPRYQPLFPPHWAHWQATGPGRLAGQLAAFWENINSGGES